MHHEEMSLSVDENNDSGAGAQPKEHFLLDRRIGVGRRQHLEQKIGGTGKILLALELGRGEPLVGDEGDVRCANLVGFGAQEETRLRSENDSYVVAIHIDGQADADSAGSPAVLVSRRWHSAQLPLDKLVPPAVIGHTKKVIGGQ
jgi:hypothetical protein